MMHSGEKPHQCYQCDIAFLLKNYLIVTLRTHSEEKLYKCGQRDKAFLQNLHEPSISMSDVTYLGKKTY